MHSFHSIRDISMFAASLNIFGLSALNEARNCSGVAGQCVVGSKAAEQEQPNFASSVEVIE